MKHQTKILYVCMVMIALLAVSCCQETTRYTKQEQANIDLCRLIHDEGVNKQNPDFWDDKLTDNWLRHCEGMPPELQLMSGLDSMKTFLASHFEGFPDWNEEITTMIADGDYVFYMTTGTGTHTGMMPMIPVITNKSVNIQTFIVQRFEGDKIAETWVSWDNVAFLSQLGLFPPPEVP